MTALKAQAAKCQVVTSGYAALQETVVKDEEEIKAIHEKPEELDKFVDRIVEAIKTPRDEKALEKIAEQVKSENDWSVVAKKWNEALL